MYIFTRHPLTGYLFKFRIISSDISQSSKISKKSKFKRDFYKHKSMLSAPFESTMAPPYQRFWAVMLFWISLVAEN